jgi:hypothetical protein
MDSIGPSEVMAWLSSLGYSCVADKRIISDDISYMLSTSLLKPMKWLVTQTASRQMVERLKEDIMCLESNQEIQQRVESVSSSLSALEKELHIKCEELSAMRASRNALLKRLEEAAGKRCLVQAFINIQTVKIEMIKDYIQLIRSCLPSLERDHPTNIAHLLNTIKSKLPDKDSVDLPYSSQAARDIMRCKDQLGNYQALIHDLNQRNAELSTIIKQVDIKEEAKKLNFVPSASSFINDESASQKPLEQVGKLLEQQRHIHLDTFCEIEGYENEISNLLYSVPPNNSSNSGIDCLEEEIACVSASISTAQSILTSLIQTRSHQDATNKQLEEKRHQIQSFQHKTAEKQAKITQLAKQNKKMLSVRLVL